MMRKLKMAVQTGVITEHHHAALKADELTQLPPPLETKFGSAEDHAEFVKKIRSFVDIKFEMENYPKEKAGTALNNLPPPQPNPVDSNYSVKEGEGEGDGDSKLGETVYVDAFEKMKSIAKGALIPKFTPLQESKILEEAQLKEMANRDSKKKLKKSKSAVSDAYSDDYEDDEDYEDEFGDEELEGDEGSEEKKDSRLKKKRGSFSDEQKKKGGFPQCKVPIVSSRNLLADDSVDSKQSSLKSSKSHKKEVVIESGGGGDMNSALERLDSNLRKNGINNNVSKSKKQLLPPANKTAGFSNNVPSPQQPLFPPAARNYEIRDFDTDEARSLLGEAMAAASEGKREMKESRNRRKHRKR